MLDKKRLRIGLSVDTSRQHVWQNGPYQNAIFLAEVLQRLDFVASVQLIDVAAPGKATVPDKELVGTLLHVSPREAAETVDVVIELAGVFDPKWLALMRARGKKLVQYQAVQPYVALVEPVIFDKPGDARWDVVFDEVWSLPRDRQFVPLMRVAHRCVVHEVPLIWRPEFVEQRATRVRDHGLEYGYGRQAGEPDADRGARVAIFEPNVSVTRSACIPMIICDDAYREDCRSVRAMHVVNSAHMKDHPTLLHLANSLALVRDKRATFLGLQDVVSFMPQCADMVVAHQWGNEQHYLALDVLYGGYPLVHNAEWMREAGYYYPDFDVDAGARLVRQAALEHALFLEEYGHRSKRIFRRIDPLQPDNLAAYATRLIHLCEGARA